MMEFHVSRQERDKYQFLETLFSADARIIFANFHGSYLFVQKMNAQRVLIKGTTKNRLLR
jgi:hypothetical protein